MLAEIIHHIYIRAIIVYFLLVELAFYKFLFSKFVTFLFLNKVFVFIIIHNILADLNSCLTSKMNLNI